LIEISLGIAVKRHALGNPRVFPPGSLGGPVLFR
jgi:hypothetical protein